MALAVRMHPDLVGRPLAESVCPRCEAAHCFAVDETPPAWIGVNLYEPQAPASRCVNCGKTLTKPDRDHVTVRKGSGVAEGLEPGVGLKCSRCQSVCCVTCCQLFTRNRTQDGSLLCPRCTRGPVEEIFYF